MEKNIKEMGISEMVEILNNGCDKRTKKSIAKHLCPMVDEVCEKISNINCLTYNGIFFCEGVSLNQQIGVGLYTETIGLGNYIHEEANNDIEHLTEEDMYYAIALKEGFNKLGIRSGLYGCWEDSTFVFDNDRIDYDIAYAGTYNKDVLSNEEIDFIEYLDAHAEEYDGYVDDEVFEFDRQEMCDNIWNKISEKVAKEKYNELVKKYEIKFDYDEIEMLNY